MPNRTPSIAQLTPATGGVSSWSVAPLFGLVLLCAPACTDPVKVLPATQSSSTNMSNTQPTRQASAEQVAAATPSASGGTSPESKPVATRETAILAGGCFWGMQDLLRKIPGVIKTDVGYTGGKTPNPTYHDLHDGTTGHAESVRIVFDPRQLTYSDLLEKWFFRMHDPTTPNRQGNDRGSQYRSAIFVTSDEQRKTAIDVKARVDASGKWKAPIVTEIATAGPFTLAEDYHQDYLEKNPGGYTCHYMRP